MFGLMQLAAELDNPFRDSGFGFDKAVAPPPFWRWRRRVEDEGGISWLMIGLCFVYIFVYNGLYMFIIGL